jgi:tetratricopeptide (TPR) repeat protein
MSQQALAIARELGDRSLLLEALVSTFHSLSGPDSIDALLAAADEVLRLDGPPLTWWSGEAFFARYNALLQRGDAAAADRALEAFGQCAKRLRISEAVWQHDRVKAQRAMYAGDFAGAEASFHDLYSRSARFRIYGAFQYAAQMNALSWVRTGRPLAAALQGTQEVAWKWAASIATFRAEKVLILLDAGDRDAARAEFRDVSRDNFRAVSRDLSYLYALCRLALAAVALEAKDEAVTLAALLRPYAKFFGINGLAISVGSVAHFLGLLARFLGDSAGAARHLEEAVEMNGRLGHTVHALQSKAALAAVLREHGTEGGAARAEALVAEVRAEADRLGMTSV